MNEKEFKESVIKLGITLTDNQYRLLEQYYELLIEWNEKMNLTAITEKKDVYLKHFYDSLTLATIVDLTNNITLCDIGSGAGFPGIVLKICFPNLKITLVDSLNKRITFLNHVINTLNLKDIEAIHERAEIFSKKHAEEYDIVTARAVSKLNILLEYALPMLKIGGVFIAMKGNVEDEIKNAQNALTLLKAKIVKIEELTLPFENSNRTLIKIEKHAKTSPLYPRNFDKISKKPL